ncbi:hypothetical protein BHM03_00043081 [Ensete ventricosum]|nr:hypothetical protein BHM03_00043081 [Ensete ventricosum]
MAETYGGRATAMAWDRGMGRHAALMGMGQAASCLGPSTSDSRSDADLVPWADVASSKVLSCEITRGNERRDELTSRCLLLKGRLAYSLSGSAAFSGSRNDDIFSGGTETADVTMAELVRRPRAMAKLQHEVRGIASRKGMVKEEELNEMVYLKAIIKEVLRIHPPVPLLVPRELMEDCQIQGYNLPKKTRVIVNAWAISRDPTHWEAPDEFKPERFLGDGAMDFKGNDFEFTPF